MKTTALDRYAVRGRVPQEALDVLSLADEFRVNYCARQQLRHDAFINLRNDLFPSLLPSLERHERAKARVTRLEQEIKSHHSEKRDRNAVTPEQEEHLRDARSERKESKAAAKDAQKPWFDLQKQFREQWKVMADWKNVKSLEKRRAMYADISLAGDVARYADLWMEHDLAERELFVEYQLRGLHSAIRAEIVESSKPKTSRTSPGMRYRYGRRPEPESWEKLTIQFAGGLTLAEAHDGMPGFTLEPEERSDMLRVHQQIGTAAKPERIAYRIRVHRPIPADAVLQRWTLRVTREQQTHHMKDGSVREVERVRGFAVPIAKTCDRDKPLGSGVLHYDLSWSVCEGGVNVCRFWSDHVNEFLVVPAWLLAARMAVTPEQAEIDERCNRFLAERGATTSGKKLQGLSALEEFADKWTSDVGAANLLDECNLRMWRAKRRSKRAERRIEHLYKNVVRRVCCLHDKIVHDKLDLAWAARYATRDLLVVDEIPRESRAIRQAIAPGKLRLYMQQYGLDASDEVRDPPPALTRETDVFTSYVASWRPAKRRRIANSGRRSQSGSPAGTVS